MMEMLTSNLEDFEDTCSRLRKMLKTRDLPAYLEEEKSKKAKEADPKTKVKIEKESRIENLIREFLKRVAWTIQLVVSHYYLITR